MKLKEFLNTSQTLSAKASDTCRTLSLGGIAIVWVFKVTVPTVTAIVLPKPLAWAVALFAASLALDLLQYFVGSFIWKAFHARHEGKTLSDLDLKAPSWLNKPAYAFYILKVLGTIAGYVLILMYLLGNVIFV